MHLRASESLDLRSIIQTELSAGLVTFKKTNGTAPCHYDQITSPIITLGKGCSYLACRTAQQGLR
eukprot:scaffold120807_cov19-Prasinocladus_malaysianus.AAC.1